MSQSAEGEPNLTPILDMVFQLITFFMLVTNFKAKAIDQTLSLPVVGSAKAVDAKDEQSLLILNIDKAGALKHSGLVKTNVEQFIANTAASRRISLGLAKDDSIADTVVIRADQETPFAKLNKVIKACQDRGYRNFALKALDKPKSVKGAAKK